MDNSTLNIWLGEKERNEVIPGYPPSCQLHNTVSVHVCILSHSLCLCSDVTNFSQERIYYMCVTRSVWSVFLYTVTWNWLQGSQQNIGFFFKTHNRMLIKLSPPPPQKKNKKTKKNNCPHLAENPSGWATLILTHISLPPQTDKVMLALVNTTKFS